MNRLTRREMVKTTIAGGLFLGLQDRAISGPNSEVRLGLVGLGGVDIEGSVGGRGRQLLQYLRKIEGAKVVAVADVDEAVLHHGVELLKGQGQQVKAHGDLRRVFDDDNVDAVLLAIPNHWHALATIWACQAGKDVYVEKPFSHSIWEGRQMVAAARKHGRMVQTGTQSRSSPNLVDAVQYLRSGELGAIQCVHALIYRPRGGLARVDKPTPPPSTVNYDLWCGPTQPAPLMRKNLHYEWHWFWNTGNGEIGNNGPHTIDVARWALGQNQLPPRALSIAGRFGVDDAAETPNTHIAFYDYRPAPLICEVRNLRLKDKEIGTYRGTSKGIIVACEGGSYQGDSSGGTVFDKQGKKVKEIRRDKAYDESLHMANFLDTVRSRNQSSLTAEAEIGHVSAGCCHMANLSHRLGKAGSPDAIRERINGNAELSDSLQRCQEHLRTNGVDLNDSQAVLGPWVTWDHDQQKFTGEFAEAANQLDQPAYRNGFEVPRLV